MKCKILVLAGYEGKNPCFLGKRGQAEEKKISLRSGLVGKT